MRWHETIAMHTLARLVGPGRNLPEPLNRATHRVCAHRGHVRQAGRQACLFRVLPMAHVPGTGMLKTALASMQGALPPVDPYRVRR